MQDGGCHGYLRRDKIEVGTNRRIGSVYVPLRSSLEDFIGALEHAPGDCRDICVDARVLATFITRPKVVGTQQIADRRIGLVLSAESFGQLPARILAELVNTRVILDLPTAVLPWGLLADTPMIEEVRLGPEFASHARRLRELPLLRKMLSQSQFVRRVSLSAPTRDWIADGMLDHFVEAGIHSIECPPLSEPSHPERPKIIRGPFEVIHGEPYRSV